MKSLFSIYRIAGFFGVISVVILALASHYLEDKLPLKSLNSLKVAGELELIHSIALLAISEMSINEKLKRQASLLIIYGIICFSFSIYLLTFNKLLDISIFSYLWPLTPIGGILLISAWLLVFLKGNKIKSI